MKRFTIYVQTIIETMLTCGILYFLGYFISGTLDFRDWWIIGKIFIVYFFIFAIVIILERHDDRVNNFYTNNRVKYESLFEQIKKTLKNKN